MLCFMLVFLAVHAGLRRDVASSTMRGMAAAMTNTGFVALPILHSIYGQPAILPAAVATVFVAAVMFPTTVVLLESEGRGAHGLSASPVGLVRQIVLNPMVLSTLIGLVWAIAGLRIPTPMAAYMNIFAAALTPCALLAIGLGLSVEGMRSNPRGPFLRVTLLGTACIVRRARDGEARDHAVDRLRSACSFGPRPALSDCRRRLCRRSDREDGLYPGTRAQRGGGTGCRHDLDHNDAVGGDAARVALRSFINCGAGGLSKERGEGAKQMQRIRGSARRDPSARYGFLFNHLGGGTSLQLVHLKLRRASP